MNSVIPFPVASETRTGISIWPADSFPNADSIASIASVMEISDRMSERVRIRSFNGRFPAGPSRDRSGQMPTPGPQTSVPSPPGQSETARPIKSRNGLWLLRTTTVESDSRAMRSGIVPKRTWLEKLFPEAPTIVPS